MYVVNQQGHAHTLGQLQGVCTAVGLPGWVELCWPCACVCVCHASVCVHMPTVTNSSLIPRGFLASGGAAPSGALCDCNVCTACCCACAYRCFCMGRKPHGSGCERVGKGGVVCNPMLLLLLFSPSLTRVSASNNQSRLCVDVTKFIAVGVMAGWKTQLLQQLMNVLLI